MDSHLGIFETLTNAKSLTLLTLGIDFQILGQQHIEPAIKNSTLKDFLF